MKRDDFFKIVAASGMGVFMPGIVDKSDANGNPSFNRNGAPVVISSGNGLPATKKAMGMIQNGADALDAVISGVNIVENDPEDISVGYGGVPNEEAVVQLDSCCMHGPTHNAGAVAAIEKIKNPSKVAKLVMERTDHVLIVGDGALQFAKAHGFEEENLLTEKTRKIWLDWKENLTDEDDWFPAKEEKEKLSSLGLETIKKGQKKRITGTINCLGLDQQGNISGVTTTSGLFFKIPGRVGDSPIIGAGLYVDNEVGACGSTGRGEENQKNLSSFMVVEFMRQGLSPEDACLKICKRLVNHAKLPNLKNEDGTPNFNVNFYAINKNGEYGSASIYGPNTYSLNDGKTNTHKKGAYLYERS